MEKEKKRGLTEIIINNRLLFFTIVLIVFMSTIKPNFIAGSNFIKLFTNTFLHFIIAFGMWGCFMTGGIDFSAGRIIGLSACIAGTFLQRPDYVSRHFDKLPNISLIAVFFLVLLLLSLVGLVNGCLISVWSLPPVIVTFGMQMVVYGISMVYTKGVSVKGFREDYAKIGSSKLIDSVPYFFFIMVFVLFMLAILFQIQGKGRKARILGRNETAAGYIMRSVTAAKIKIYVLASVLFAAAGFLSGAKAGWASVNTGYGWETEAICACAMAYVFIKDGIDKFSGILTAVFAYETIKVSLQFLKLDTSWMYVIQGIVIILAVFIYRRRQSIKIL